MGKLTGKTILISGGGRGMGASHARVLAEEGAQVMVADIDVDAAKTTAERIGEAAVAVSLDVRDQDGWRDAVRVTLDVFGRLDGLVNNAGIMKLGRTEDTPADEFLETAAVNQLGVLLGMQAVIPALREAGGGSIVNIASTAGLAGDRFLSAYCASKFAVVGMSRVAAMELGGDRIRVNAVCPGIVRTDMTSDFNAEAARLLARQLPLGRFGEPEEVSRLVAFLCSDDSSYLTGTELVADGGRLAGVLAPW